MNIPKIIVHALFKFSIRNFSFFSFFAVYCLFLEMLRIDINDINIIIMLLLCEYFISYTISLFILLYLCVYCVRYLIVFVLFCLFLNLLSSCLHTRYNVNVDSYQINQSMHLAALYTLYIKQSLYKYVCIINIYIYICALLYSRVTPTRDTPDRDRLPHYGPRFSPR